MTSELEAASHSAAAAGCFPDPEIDDQTIRRREEMKAIRIEP